MAQDPSLTGFDEAAQVQSSDIQPDWKDRVGPLLRSGVPGGQMDAMLQKHHDDRLEQARMHKQHVVENASALKMINDGINPLTHDPFKTKDANGNWQNVSGYQGEPEDTLRQRYTSRLNFSKQQFEKSVGVHKQAKAGVQKLWAILDNMIGGNQPPPITKNQPDQPQASPPPTTPQTPPPGGVPSSPTPPPNSNGGGQAAATPSAGTQAVPSATSKAASQTPSPATQAASPGPQPPIVNGKSVTEAGGEIRDAGGTKWTTPPRKPTPMPVDDDPEGALEGPELRRSMAQYQNLQAADRARRATATSRMKQANEWVDKGWLKKDSPEYRDYVMFEKPPTNASLRLGNSVEAELAAARTAEEEGDTEGVKQHLKMASDLATAKKGAPKRTPVQEEQQRALDLLHAGDTEGAKEAFNNLRQLQAKPGANGPSAWVVAAVTGTPEEQAIAKKELALDEKIKSQIRAAGYIAGATARASFQPVYTIDAATGEGQSMSQLDYAKERLAGRQLTAIAAPNFPTATGLQKFVKETPSVLKLMTTPLKDVDEAKYGKNNNKTPMDAFDNEKDRLIFARIMGEAGPRPMSENAERSWVSNVLDQAIQREGTLSPEGRELMALMARLRGSVYTVQGAEGAQKTDSATELFMAMIVNGSIPDKKQAERIMWHYNQNAKKTLVPAMKGIVQVPEEWKEPGENYDVTVPPSARGGKRPTAPPAGTPEAAPIKKRTIVIDK